MNCYKLSLLLRYDPNKSVATSYVSKMIEAHINYVIKDDRDSNYCGIDKTCRILYY